MLVPNPAHLAFDRNSSDTGKGRELLAEAVPLLERAAGIEIEGRVATRPNAYDDIVEELGRRHYTEIILETLPSHVSHWLHVDLAERIAHPRLPADDRHRDSLSASGLFRRRSGRMEHDRPMVGIR